MFAALAGVVTLVSATTILGGERPNFLVIVADDLGYSDLGVMGSEIRTPNLDALAARGLLLTDFHVTPTCSPTRAMLLTGVDPHPAGLGSMRGQASPEQDGQPGYEGVLSSGVVTVAELLGDAGYYTVMAGKWHLGSEPGQKPTERGFERAFGPVSGGSSHFSDQLAMFASSGPPGKALFLDDGKEVESLPDEWFSSTGYTDRIIAQLDDQRRDGRSFFAYAAYTAPHWPLQAPDAYIDRYVGMYDAGWDALRQQRQRALAERDLPGPDGTKPAERLPFVPEWSALPAEARARATRTMEVYAAMIEHLDHEIGRLLAYLEANGELGSTLVLFFSDNGAEGNPVNRIIDDHDWVERTFDNRLDNIGRRGSYVFPGPGWAQASTAPFNLFKAFPTQGGLLAPAIVSGHGVQRTGDENGRRDAFVTVKDVTPTILDLAGVAHPGSRYRGRSVAPLEGRPMSDLLAGRATRVHGDEDVMAWELFGRRALRKGSWKAIWLYEPYGNGRWQLFDLATDPAEQRDLAGQRPDKLRELLAAWDEYVTSNGVILPAADAGYALEDDWR
jgi:arylsulfatase A-like enzyme